MYDSNLPDDCQGNGTHLPWNEPEQTECPKCGGGMTCDDYDLICDDTECDGVIYGPDEDDF